MAQASRPAQPNPSWVKSIDVGPRHVKIEGVDISTAVRSYTMKVGADRMPELTLELMLWRDQVRCVADEAAVYVLEETAQVLQVLGWAPPAEAARLRASSPSTETPVIESADGLLELAHEVLASERPALLIDRDGAHWILRPWEQGVVAEVVNLQEGEYRPVPENATSASLDEEADEVLNFAPFRVVYRPPQ